METVFSHADIQNATYKLLKFEGNIHESTKAIGENPGIELYIDKKVYLALISETWLRKHAEYMVRDIPEKTPFAVVYGYASQFIPLEEGCYFVFGHHPDYWGGSSQRWSVYSKEGMVKFIGKEKAINLIKELSDGK